MKKLTKIFLSVIPVMVLLSGLTVSILYFAFGIDVFDRSGWDVDKAGQTRYLDYYGEPLTGWQQLEENWYYFNPEDAVMVTGWLELDGERYFLQADGTRHTGWLELEEGVYYLNPDDAALATGWLELEDGIYYLDSSGCRQTGWLEKENSRYYLDSRGLRHTGWLELDGNRYYLGEDGIMVTGWLDTPEGRSYLDENGVLRTGWLDTPEGRYYLTEDGLLATGWLEEDGKKYCLDENGQPVIGWLEKDGARYYFREDGVMAIGKVLIDEQAYYFTSTGKHVYMVNRWNKMPPDYQVQLVSCNGWQVARECYDDLVRMLQEVGKVGYYEISSAYRNVGEQQSIWNNRMSGYLAAGYSQQDAYAAVFQSVAIPGTSEHHLGLAVDIAAGTAVHSWLAQNSWRYGFILRYPNGKTAITGIVHEPWHFRYVGEELAKELYDLGLTLEEYLDMLTGQAGFGAGTASNPANSG